MSFLVTAFYLLMSLGFCYVGWRVTKFGLRTGKVAALQGHSHIPAVGLMQTFALLAGVAFFLTGIGTFGLAGYDFIDGQLQIAERRKMTLQGLEASKARVAQAEERYRLTRGSINATDRRRFERSLAEARWYSERTREEVIAESDQYLPVTFLSGKAAEKHNGELDIALAKARQARMARDIESAK